MNKTLGWPIRLMILSGALLGMGIAMPSCPGQQAMQQQIDTLQTSNTALIKKVQTMEGQISRIGEDLNTIKSALGPVGAKLMELEKGFTDINARLAAAPAKAGKPAKKAHR